MAKRRERASFGTDSENLLLRCNEVGRPSIITFGGMLSGARLSARSDLVARSAGLGEAEGIRSAFLVTTVPHRLGAAFLAGIARDIESFRLAWTYLGMTAPLIAALGGVAACDAARRALPRRATRA